MTDTHAAPDGNPPEPKDSCAATTRGSKPISMHEGVPVWHDCCCCEAEPRWVALAEELGIDLDAGWKRNGT